jgi:hypothetical protein
MIDHSKLSHSEFKNLLDLIESKADGNAAEFGLTQADVLQIQAIRDRMETDIADQAAKDAAAEAATAKLTATRKEGNKLLSLNKMTMRSNQVKDDKFAELGFGTDDSVDTPVAPLTPAELSVQGFSNGANKLKFKRNGNKQHTIFNVEAKIGNAPNFVIVGTTTTTNFNHENQTPGVKVVYRVRAQRSGGEFSEYSNEAVVYN